MEKDRSERSDKTGLEENRTTTDEKERFAVLSETGRFTISELCRDFELYRVDLQCIRVRAGSNVSAAVPCPSAWL